MEAAGLDLLDLRLLDAIQRDAAQTMRGLATQVASTPATCHRRLKRLKRQGLIRRIVAIADPRRSAEPVTAIIGLTLAGQTYSQQAKVKERLRRWPEVRMAWMTTGDFDYMLVCAFPNVEALSVFVEEVISRDERIQRYRTFLCIEDVKLETHRRFGQAGAGTWHGDVRS